MTKGLPHATEGVTGQVGGTVGGTVGGVNPRVGNQVTDTGKTVTDVVGGLGGTVDTTLGPGP